MKILTLIIFFLSSFTLVFAQKAVKVLQVPAKNQFSSINMEGVSILPSGRFVTPVGKVSRITRGAFGLSVSADNKKAVILHHNGVVTVMDLAQNEVVTTNVVCPPFTKKNQGKYSTKSPIKHVVYITKENRTYDEVFGQLKQGNGDLTLARFGLDVEIKQKDSLILKGVNVSQNHHKIVQKWSFSDNFYCDSDASIHGHHWMMGTIPNEYVEANSAAEGRFLPFPKAKGRRFPKTTGGVDPEDYNEIGGIWDNLSRNKVSFFNFGETNEFVNSHEEKFDTIFGAANSVVFPLPKVVFDHTSRDYAGYNTSIPDQFRVEQFEREFKKRWLSGKDTMPAFIGMQPLTTATPPIPVLLFAQSCKGGSGHGGFRVIIGCERANFSAIHSAVSASLLPCWLLFNCGRNKVPVHLQRKRVVHI